MTAHEHHHCAGRSGGPNERVDAERTGSSRYSRRHVLAGTAALTGLAVAGCLGDDDEATPDPIALDGGQSCFVCGMVIGDHPGPAGQLFYADENPEDHDGPVWFDSLVELENYHAEQRARGWDLLGAYVTDYSSVEYELVTHDGQQYLSSHLDASDFADATDLFYVVDSEVHGAMGADHLPFSDEAEATDFADAHDGAVVRWDDLAVSGD